MHAWLKATMSKLSEKSELPKAIHYALKRCMALIAFVEAESRGHFFLAHIRDHSPSNAWPSSTPLNQFGWGFRYKGRNGLLTKRPGSQTEPADFHPGQRGRSRLVLI